MVYFIRVCFFMWGVLKLKLKWFSSFCLKLLLIVVYNLDIV